MPPFRNLMYVERRVRGSTRGAACALELARAHGGELTVAAVLPADGGGAGAAMRVAARRRQWTARLEELVAELGGGRVEVRRLLLDGIEWTAVSDRIEAAGHDLVVTVADRSELAWPRRHSERDGLLLRHVACPVWLLHPAQGPGLREVLAAVDVTDTTDELNRRILRVAGQVAGGAGAELVVVHGWSLVGESLLADLTRGGSRRGRAHLLADERRERREHVERLISEEAGSASPSVALPHGSPVRAIEHEAWDRQADLVVVGARPHGALRDLVLGTVAERLLARVPCSVLVVPEAARGEAGAVASGRTRTVNA